MTPWLDDGDVRVHVGDVRAVLAGLPNESVDCVITSPPYWGLRDYGTGSWTGGDPDCDHTTPRSRGDDIRDGDKQGTSAGSRPNTANVCGKCGAQRVDQQLGLEPTPDLYVQNMVAVFREVRRVLAPHGTCWLNLGDSYASGGGAGNQGEGGQMATRSVVKARVSRPRGGGGTTTVDVSLGGVTGAGLKPKDLVGIPWRVAFALQADGWWLRSDIIWAKPNPMPESVTDRPTKIHEYVFLLSKRSSYWFDQEAVREPYEPTTLERNAYARTKHVRQSDGSSGGASYLSTKAGGERVYIGPTKEEAWNESSDTSALFAGGSGTSPSDGTPTSESGCSATPPGDFAPTAPPTRQRSPSKPSSGRNVRSVWEIATQPFAAAHFATFPEELVRRCLLAGCPAEVCSVCGKPRERIVERTPMVLARSERRDQMGEFGRTQSSGTMVSPPSAETVGWSDCGHHAYRPGLVLDPFLGSGTTALVARQHGRHAVGVELNPEYAAIAARRLQQLSLLA